MLYLGVYRAWPAIFQSLLYPSSYLSGEEYILFRISDFLFIDLLQTTLRLSCTASLGCICIPSDNPVITHSFSRISVFPSSILPDISELELKLSEHSKKLLSLQQMVDDLASKYAYNPDEEYTETESQLRGQLESFLETAKSFNLIYNKEIRPWTHMMEVPQLHGFGPAANRLLEAYKMLLKFLWNLRNLRDSHAAVAVGSSEGTKNESSSTSITRIIAECESALTFLNHDLGVLSASVSRERGEEVPTH
ncbi:hypothetical protein MKW94_019576 [Papaver nudicaule]|uniref:Uncharacterized protein n=1 Tax=Papaver nudicaule TaxID=74823 RepID=A0AA42B0S3_PAPNU|nr:hypothetical protein [Papaver nudicaule]